MKNEREALELWCPMVRIARLEPVEVVQANGSTKTSDVALSFVGGCNTAAGVGKGPRIPASCRCVASQCAMWRWGDAAPRIDQTTASVEAQAKRRGHCGLAGPAVYA